MFSENKKDNVKNKKSNLGRLESIRMYDNCLPGPNGESLHQPKQKVTPAPLYPPPFTPVKR